VRLRVSGRSDHEFGPLDFIGPVVRVRAVGMFTDGHDSRHLAITGKMVTLNVSSAQDERVLNRETTSTIESFKANQIVVKSSVGETSTFRRLL
jgi:hypothetical protein